MSCLVYTIINTGSSNLAIADLESYLGTSLTCTQDYPPFSTGGTISPSQSATIILTAPEKTLLDPSADWVILGPITPTPTQTPTNTPTPTQTPTNTETPTNTPTQTSTETPTNTPTNTETPTQTTTETNTPTPTQTPTETPTNTPTNTETPTNTPTNTETPTNTPTNTETPTNTPTNTETPTNTPTNTETPTNTPTETPTTTPTPTPTQIVYTFEDCCDTNNRFNVSDIPGTLFVGNFYFLNTSVFSGCAQVITLQSGLPIYTLINSTSYGDCITCLITESVICSSPTPTNTPTNTETPTETPTNTPTNTETPTNTPTNTETPTNTPTNTPTPTATEVCPNVYCLNTGGVTPFDGEYYLTGIHNTYDYYTGGTGTTAFIYYDTTKWCLSLALDGPCILFGKTPCNSVCPDLCDELQPGLCPPPIPPGPCETFEFEALFDCNIPLPSNTPSVSPTTTTTPTPTNTPTITQKCFSVGMTLSATTLPTPTMTPTPTITPTNIDRNICFIGAVNYEIFDETLVCSELNVLKNCATNAYFYVIEPIEIQGIELPSGVTINVVIDGNSECVYYEGKKLASKNATLNSVISVIQDCSFCSNLPPTSTPTPTKTTGLTPEPTSTPTKTPTPTKTTGLTPEPTTTPTMTPTQTKTPGLSAEPTSTPTMTPTQTETPNSCNQMYFVVCKSPSSSATTISVSGNTLYNGRPYFILENNSMNVVYWDSGTTKWVSSVSGLTGTTMNSLDNNNNPLPIADSTYQWEFDCDTLSFVNNVVVDSYTGPCITPTITPTATITPTKTRNNCYQYEVFALGGSPGQSYPFTYTKCDLTPGTGLVQNGAPPITLCGISNSFTSTSPFVNFGSNGPIPPCQ